MKLIVDEVNYGLVPYGPGTGTRAIGISFKEIDGSFDYEPELDENGKPKVENEKVIIATGILNDILKVIKDKKYEDAWINFLLGREYIYFIGEVIASPEYREIIGIMFKGISETALEIQKKTFSEVPDEERLAAVKNKLRAPMPVFVCKPKYYTGRDMFYENFNLILLQLPLTEDEKINQMTMVEVSIQRNFRKSLLNLSKGLYHRLRYRDNSVGKCLNAGFNRLFNCNFQFLFL